MEVLNSYICTPVDGFAIFLLTIVVGMVVFLVAYMVTDSGVKSTIATILAMVIICGALLFINIKCTETHYQGYITNWEEYCEQYDTINVEGKLVTAKLKKE